MTTPTEQLAEYRASIDNLDAILLHTLAERFKITQAVGRLKATHDMPPADKERESQPDCAPAFTGNDLWPRSGLCRKIPQFCGGEVIRHHEKIREKG